MRLYDLSHTITNDMPVYPGTEAPRIERPFTVDQNGFAESRLTIFSHVGTHMDAPKHMLKGGKALDDYEIDHFQGKALIMDFSKLDKARITLEDVLPYEAYLDQVDFVLLYTGWSRYWKHPKYFSAFPTLSIEAALWIGNYDLKGLGVDAISVDTIDTKDFGVHHIMLKKGMVIIENLTNLSEVKEGVIDFMALPLKFEGADGGPTRALAMVASS